MAATTAMPAPVTSDGEIRDVTDVWFVTDFKDTTFLDEIEVPEDIKGLPDLRGWGVVPSFHQVMARDASGRLKGLLEAFVAADVETAKTLTWDIILAWTGTTDMDPASRGPGVRARFPEITEYMTKQDRMHVFRVY